MSNQNSVEAPVFGGWTAYGPVTEKDQNVWNVATKGLVGVKYTPQSVSTQVVAGTNYRFRCSASMPPSNAVWEAIVEIFAPLPGQGEPYITGIIRL